MFLNEVLTEDSHLSTLTKDKYNNLIEEIKSAKYAVSKTAKQY